MKEVLSVFTFGIGAVCFVVFISVLKPHAYSAVAGPIKLEYCSTEAREPDMGDCTRRRSAPAAAAVIRQRASHGGGSATASAARKP